MTTLVVRRPAFAIADDAPFLWQPMNPAFALFCNLFTFVAVPFEKYLVTVMRDAQRRISDPAVADEAEAFLRQEAQHANAHRRHMSVLIQRYPGLQEVHDHACASYDDLLATRPLEFHLAYIANLEATFTPLFKLVLDNRASLFGSGDAAIGSLMMWHFVEEIEHRSSGLTVCNHIVSSPWYRTRHIKATFDHVGRIAEAIARAFEQHVPAEDRRISTDVLTASFGALTGPRLPWTKRGYTPPDPPPLFHAVPSRDIARMLFRLALSQLPHHDPADQPLPAWAAHWTAEHDRGVDMTTHVWRR
jgi:predicted metal-dependent hydrolase